MKLYVFSVPAAFPAGVPRVACQPVLPASGHALPGKPWHPAKGTLNTYVKLITVLVWAAATMALAAGALAEEMVPFVIPATPNPKSLIALSSPAIPTDAERLVARDGHFWVGARRVRIWGVNTCFGASFPTHADAERIAARLAAFGVNSVRFHHMDSASYPHGILDPKDPLKLSPEAVERLDYFIDQLARRGIYANVNLHVGRDPSGALGLPDPNSGQGKIVAFFTPALIEAQKQYARDLLGHTNVYRKVRYAADPAVGFVEITNEDSFFMWDGEERLRSLPEFYAKILREKYAAWLKGRYKTTQALRAAWSKGAEPLGENMLADADFRMPEPRDAKSPRWTMEQHEGCAARLVHPADNPKAARLEISKADETNWHLQLKQSPLAVQAGRYYTLAFRARADRPRTISYGVGQDHEPWQGLGLWGEVRLVPEWQAFRVGFVANASDADARLSFSFGGNAAAVELADVALMPGGREGLRKEETIEAATVALFAPSEVEARTLDRLQFLAETEKAYFDGMRSFLKKDLGSKALVTGTIVFGPLGLYAQSDMDYVDGHAYWQHPQFPGRPWDPDNWLVGQRAMVDHPADSTLPGLAAQRLYGKPYTVSEYNHPAPNDYQAECVPMIASFAAAQDWDGVWLFAYSHEIADPAEKGCFTSFFDISANPAKWGFMPAGAAIFREGGILPLKRFERVNLSYTKEVLVAPLAALHMKYGSNMLAAVNATGGLGGTCNRLEVSLSRLVSRRLDGGMETLTSDSLSWWADKQGIGQFHATGPGAQVLVTHWPYEGSTGLGLAFSRPFFAVMTMTALDGQPIEKSKAVLVTACGRCENTDMRFSADRRTVGRNWGKAPVLIEPVESTSSLPKGSWKCVALAPDGTPQAEVPVDGDKIKLSPAYKTMWYLLTPATEKQKENK